MLFWVALAGYVTLLWWNPTADPPLGPTDLEGQMLQSSVTFAGKPNPLGEWNPALVIPIQSLITGVVFRAAGTDLGHARMLSAAAAVLALVLLHGMVARSRGPGTALLAALLLMTNPVFHVAARTSLPAGFSMLWMLLAIRLWLLGARYRGAAFLAGLALVGAGLIENGPDAVFFLGAGLLMTLFLRLQAWRMPWLQPVRARLGAVFTGATLALLLLLTLVSRHWEGYGILWDRFHGAPWRLVASNVVMAPVYASRLVEHMPVPAFVVLVYFLFFAKDVVWPVARHRRPDETRLWFLSWLLAGGVFLLVTPGAGLQRLALMTPPLCAVAAEGLVRLYGLRRFTRPRMDVMIVMLLIAGAVWFAVSWGVNAFYTRLVPDGFLLRHQIRGAFLIVVVLTGGFTALFGWLYLTWKRFSLNLHPAVVPWVWAVVTAATLVPGAATIAAWHSHPRYEVASVAVRLREALPDTALVAGAWAPLLTLEGPQRAAVVFEGVNDRLPPWGREVTHLLLREGAESRAGRPPRSVFPPAAAVSGVYDVWGTRLRLYRVEAPDNP